jgi:hypothetical protein
MSDTAVLSPVAHERLFPLRLSPIELFMLADDQAGYPMNSFIELQLQGQIARGAFEAALAEALERHPFLRALVAPGRGGAPSWMEAIGHMPDGDWAPEDTAITCSRGDSIDLTKEIGLRVWVRQGSQRAKVLLQVHHACSDGTGVYRFIGDLLAVYGIRTTTAGPRPVLGTVEPTLLRTRKQRTLDAAAHLGWFGLNRLAVAKSWKIISRRPTPLAPPAAASACRATDFPGFLTFSFSRVEHEHLREAAQREGVTLNDLLLRDLFLTLAHWNGQRRSLWQRPWLRIMMPTDLRSGEDYEMPAANMTAYTFIGRKAADCASPAELLQSIRNETALIKHQRLGAGFMDLVYAASEAPRLLRFFLSRKACLATVVHSNVADPSRRFSATLPRVSGQVACGNLLLEEITGVPPLRVKTRATFSISQYNRRLAISLRCDPHLFRLEDTAALLDLYVERLRSSAAIGDVKETVAARAA